MIGRKQKTFAEISKKEFFIFGDEISLCSPGDLKLTAILLPQLTKCWRQAWATATATREAVIFKIVSDKYVFIAQDVYVCNI